MIRFSRLTLVDSQISGNFFDENANMQSSPSGRCFKDSCGLNSARDKNTQNRLVTEFLLEVHVVAQNDPPERVSFFPILECNVGQEVFHDLNELFTDSDGDKLEITWSPLLNVSKYVLDVVDTWGDGALRSGDFIRIYQKTDMMTPQGNGEYFWKKVLDISTFYHLVSYLGLYDDRTSRDSD